MIKFSLSKLLKRMLVAIGVYFALPAGGALAASTDPDQDSKMIGGIEVSVAHQTLQATLEESGQVRLQPAVFDARDNKGELSVDNATFDRDGQLIGLGISNPFPGISSINYEWKATKQAYAYNVLVAYRAKAPEDKYAFDKQVIGLGNKIKAELTRKENNALGLHYQEPDQGNTRQTDGVFIWASADHVYPVAQAKFGVVPRPVPVTVESLPPLKPLPLVRLSSVLRFADCHNMDVKHSDHAVRFTLDNDKWTAVQYGSKVCARMAGVKKVQGLVSIVAKIQDGSLHIQKLVAANPVRGIKFATLSEKTLTVRPTASWDRRVLPNPQLDIALRAEVKGVLPTLAMAFTSKEPQDLGSWSQKMGLYKAQQRHEHKGVITDPTGKTNQPVNMRVREAEAQTPGLSVPAQKAPVMKLTSPSLMGISDPVAVGTSRNPLLTALETEWNNAKAAVTQWQRADAADQQAKREAQKALVKLQKTLMPALHEDAAAATAVASYLVKMFEDTDVYSKKYAKTKTRNLLLALGENRAKITDRDLQGRVAARLAGSQRRSAKPAVVLAA